MSQAGCLQKKALSALCPSHHLHLSACLSKSTSISMVPHNVALQGKFRGSYQWTGKHRGTLSTNFSWRKSKVICNPTDKGQ